MTLRPAVSGSLPRRGSLRAACGLLLLAVLACGARGVVAGAPGAAEAAAPTAGKGGVSIAWAAGFDAALQQAQAEQKFVMIDFFTHWCGWCKVLDAKTYTDPKVVELASRMVNVKVNAESEPQVASRYGVRAYPTIVFLNPDGTLRQKIQGFRPPEGFVPVQEDVMKTDSEVFALARRIDENPRDPELRLSCARTLALGGKYREAVAQMDTLLLLDPAPQADRPAQELERWSYLQRAGAGEDARKGLEGWAKKGKKHPLYYRGLLLLAQANDQAGKSKDARKLYQEIVKKNPGSWYAGVARSKLSRG